MKNTDQSFFWSCSKDKTPLALQAENTAKSFNIHSPQTTHNFQCAFESAIILNLRRPGLTPDEKEKLNCAYHYLNGLSYLRIDDALRMVYLLIFLRQHTCIDNFFKCDFFLLPDYETASTNLYFLDIQHVMIGNKRTYDETLTGRLNLFCKSVESAFSGASNALYHATNYIWSKNNAPSSQPVDKKRPAP